MVGRLRRTLPPVALLLSALVLGACDEEEGPMGPESFVKARLTTRDGAVDFSGAATLTTDTLGNTTCRGTNGDGYGVSVTWGGGVAVIETPIALSQEVSVKTEAPGMPGVLVDDFFAGELRFTEIEENFAGTFRADPKVEGEERAIVEVSGGEFLCVPEEGGEEEEG